MLRIPRRKLLAPILIALLALSLALPAVATPIDVVGPSFLSWLRGWLGWPSENPVQAVSGTSEIHAGMDLDAPASPTQPAPTAPGNTAQNTLDATGDRYPGLDPDG